MNMTCDIINAVEVTSRFILPEYNSPRERLVSSTNTMANSWAIIFGDNMERVSGVYEIVNTVNGHRYVGSSNNIYRRWQDHRRELRNKIHCNKILQRAWDKYGDDALKFNVLLQCEVQDIIFYEQFYFSVYPCEYNISKIAAHPRSKQGFKFSDKSIEKMRESHRGKHPSAETLQRMSEAQKLIGNIPSSPKGKRKSFQHRINNVEFLRGNSVADITKNKISDKLKGNVPWNNGLKGGNYNVSLSDRQKEEIKKLYAEGNLYQREIASIYGVSESVVFRAIHSIIGLEDIRTIVIGKGE